ncbi:MAG: RNase J family beta-CASP ribonuclease [Nanoarchaeota archaeon]
MKIHAIGGYNEVGKNMTALEIDEDVFIFDSGLFLPAIIAVQERDKILTEKGMRALGALPDDIYLENKGLRNKVRAILVSHAHLDHVGGIPYNAQRYDASVLGTPYTTEVLKVLMQDNSQTIKNKIISVKLNSTVTIRGKSDNYKIEFINITHSTIESAMIAVHTKEGVVIYANDFKLDNTPTFGDKPNYKRLLELSKIGVKALIVDCLYAYDDRKTPSERIARGLLEEVMLAKNNNKSAMVVTTFSSHIARLKSITEFGKKLGREILFLGRSLAKYTTAARNIGKAPFIKDVRVLTYRRQVEQMLKKVERDREKYLIVCTGHQGEPGSILDRMARNEFNFKLRADDQVIFSSKTIPTPINEANREELEQRLKKHHVRIFDNIHVSGHGGREDLRDLINILKPEHVIPSHGDLKKTTAGAKLAEEMGYKLNKNVHLMENLKQLEIKN